MDGTNFYLAASAVIPILGLTQAIQRSVVLRASSEEAENRLRLAIRRARVGAAVWDLGEILLFALAEYVCLRRLETGRAPLGGADIVWAGLLYGAINIALIRLVGRIEEEDARRCLAWFEARGAFTPRRGKEVQKWHGAGDGDVAERPDG